MGRTIGIRHRRKKTAEGESRPTQVTIVDGDQVKTYNLPDDQAELDFVFGLFPTHWRDRLPQDQPRDFPRHQLKWRKLEADEDPATLFPPEWVEKRGKKWYTVAKTPCEFEGLRPDDTIAMPFGGSGDMFAYALVRRAEAVGAEVLRLPFYRLKQERGKNEEEDALLIARLVDRQRELFCSVQPRDKAIILMRELHRQRIKAMQARIACEQRLWQVCVGQIFTSLAVEVEIEKRFAEEKANDQILKNLLALEDEANARLAEAIQDLDVYQQVFAPIEGMGPQIAARIIAGIVDIRRFPDRDKFVAFCGVSPGADGKFRRHRLGETCNWSGARQGLWLMIREQANRRPDSVWGQRFREMKARQREKHPEEVIISGKRRFTDSHIHRRSSWPAMVKLARQIYREWRKLSNSTVSLQAKTGQDDGD
ncbi:MAG: IS110 family transposase [Candidatus Vogelbacteria bacterium]|nr:IS110 family transposase [Candidatus Vogelbacteria bacterium]